MIPLVVDPRKAASVLMRSFASNKPQHVQWLLTRKCNYRCRGCNVWQEQDTRELSTEEVKRGLDVLRKMGVVEVVFSGGNPLLRDDIGEILEYASRFFITTVYDNGSMAANKINALRFADFVAISIDSLDPQKNDYLKGVEGAWCSAMEAVEKLKENGISVSISPTISQCNLYEILDFTKQIIERGIPVWYCLYSYDSPEGRKQLFGIGRKSDEYAIVDRKGIVELCDRLIEMRKRYDNILMTTKVLTAIKNIYLRGIRTWKCRALQNFFVVNHVGEVAGCHLHEPVASIFDLPKVWNSERFEALRRIYRECTRCTYLCYIFYSLHSNILGNLQIATEHWKNAKLLLKRKSNQILMTPKSPKTEK
jgi:MoaA/NifB/PqqE/SkfB family radical SAM enzyme